MSPIEKARALYVALATRPERDRLSVAESHAKNLLDKSARVRVARSLPELRRKLVQAERMCGQIFDDEVSS